MPMRGGVAHGFLLEYTGTGLSEKENQVAPKTVIDGKYELGRIIGSGGMGTVYEATQVGLDRKVALKLLRSKYSKSSKIVTRFQQEARLAGSIEHDNICRVTDYGTAENGAPYLVMPLLNGRSLAKMLKALADEGVVDGLGWDEDEIGQMLGGIPEVEFPEYDESARDDVEWIECPECGHRWPK